MSVASPPPLMAPEVDLRDFEYMPLFVRRLRDSTLVATRPAEEVLAAFLLWCASWHQQPASSIPDDDREIANLAGFGRAVDAFKALRDGALYGFVKCADGRWYHPIVAERAADSWNAKLKDKHKRLCDKIRKSNKDRSETQPFPPEPTMLSARIVDGFPVWRAYNSSGNDGEIRRKSRLKVREGKGREVLQPPGVDSGSLSDLTGGKGEKTAQPPVDNSEQRHNRDKKSSVKTEGNGKTGEGNHTAKSHWEFAKALGIQPKAGEQASQFRSRVARAVAEQRMAGNGMGFDAWDDFGEWAGIQRLSEEPDEAYGVRLVKQLTTLSAMRVPGEQPLATVSSSG